ncbi:hypothetical protein DV735_g267, partial [Chaetothyriales sp. CBS 134920]
MVRLAYLSLTVLTLAVSRVVSQGTQFITGPCDTDADCASGCCGFNSGKCAGPIIALTRDGGCGHGNAQPNANAANALGQGTFTVSGAAAAAATTLAVGGASSSTATTSASPAQGTQFITGTCNADADCASGCCGFNSGKCAGPIIALTRDGGCGHGDAQPNANAANALGQGTFTFITGPCDSDADCASSCCGFNSGKCAGPVVAQERDGGCGHGDAQPNDDAAQALRNGRKRGLWDD